MTQASTISSQEKAAPSASCPRCQQPLVDPNGLGWCKACGYCRSLDESPKSAEPTNPTTAPALRGIAATGSALAQTPIWFPIMLIGIAVIVGATYCAGRFLALTPLNRALCTTIQIAAGIGVMFLGQFIALMRIAPEDMTLSFKDALFPFRLYGLVMKRLPSTRHTVYLGAWGLAAIVAAIVFMGGLEHWFSYLPSSKHKAKTNATQRTGF